MTYRETPGSGPYPSQGDPRRQSAQPARIAGGPVPDITVTTLVVYVQIGIITLGYLVFRRLAAIHGELALQRGRTEVALQSLDALLGTVNERVGLLERLSRRVRPGYRLQLGGIDLRARAIEMAGQGASPADIASALQLRRPEAELLVKLQKFREQEGVPEAVRFR